MNASTAKPDEIAKFNALAAKWWDPNGPMAPLHQMNPLRCGWIADRLAASRGRRDQDLRGLEILDVGCGAGLASEALATYGARVTGLDAAAEPISVARAHAEGSGLPVSYRQGTPEELVGQGLAFDAIAALEIIEHVSDRGAFLQALSALVRQDGLIFLSTINRTSRAYAMAKLGAEYLLQWLPKGTHDWRMFVTPAELGAEARSAGFVVEDLSGMSFKGRGWASSSDVSVNYIMALRRC